MKPRFSAAAGLAVAIFALGSLVLFFSTKGQAQVVHTCSATDRQFISVAQLNMAALGSLSEDYLHGDAKASDVMEQTSSSLVVLANTNPSDPSLSKTRAIMRAMFLEYGKAIKANEKKKDPGKFIYRAYGFANFAHDVLSQARPALLQRGCDVGPLL